jgi:hypothetical protein
MSQPITPVTLHLTPRQLDTLTVALVNMTNELRLSDCCEQSPTETLINQIYKDDIERIFVKIADIKG